MASFRKGISGNPPSFSTLHVQPSLSFRTSLSRASSCFVGSRLGKPGPSDGRLRRRDTVWLRRLTQTDDRDVSCLGKPLAIGHGAKPLDAEAIQRCRLSSRDRSRLEPLASQRTSTVKSPIAEKVEAAGREAIDARESRAVVHVARPRIDVGRCGTDAAAPGAVDLLVTSVTSLRISRSPNCSAPR